MELAKEKCAEKLRPTFLRLKAEGKTEDQAKEILLGVFLGINTVIYEMSGIPSDVMPLDLFIGEPAKMQYEDVCFMIEAIYRES